MFGLKRAAVDLLPADLSHPSIPNNIFTKEKDIWMFWFDSRIFS